MVMYTILNLCWLSNVILSYWFFGCQVLPSRLVLRYSRSKPSMISRRWTARPLSYRALSCHCWAVQTLSYRALSCRCWAAQTLSYRALSSGADPLSRDIRRLSCMFWFYRVVKLSGHFSHKHTVKYWKCGWYWGSMRNDGVQALWYY